MIDVGVACCEARYRLSSSRAASGTPGDGGAEDSSEALSSSSFPSSEGRYEPSSESESRAAAMPGAETGGRAGVEADMGMFTDTGAKGAEEEGTRAEAGMMSTSSAFSSSASVRTGCATAATVAGVDIHIGCESAACI